MVSCTQHTTVLSTLKRQVSREREATQRTYRPTRAQSYIRQELRQLHADVEDVERRIIIEILERTFTSQRPTEALRRQLNLIHRNGVTGDILYNRLIELQAEHGLRDDGRAPSPRSPSEDLPASSAAWRWCDG